jgi:glycosyltransferase involved in cell wall biosynthesis
MTDHRIRVVELSSGDLRPYRIPFLGRIAESGSIRLEIWHGQPPRNFGAPTNPPQNVPVPERRVRNLFWPGGKHRVMWQSPALKVLTSDTQVVVCAEIVHNLSVWAIALLHRWFGKRLVLRGYFYRPEQRFERISGFLRRLLHRRAVAYLAYTERGRRSLLEEGVAIDRVFVSQNTLDAEMLMNLATEVDPESEALRREELDLAAAPVLMFLGKLIEAKRPDIAVELMSSLDTPASLLVIGDGSLRPDLEEKAKGLPVRFLGAIYDERELAEYLSFTDLLVLPGRVGLTCVHGFANGVACVTSHESLVEQSPEYSYVEDDYNGLIVRSTDPLDYARLIRDLLADPERLDRLSRGALEAAAQLGMGRMVDQYERAVRRATLD